MKSHISRLKPNLILAIYFMMAMFTFALAQTPTVTVRLTNPQYDCFTDQYCVDVEFLADTVGVEVFGMNVRFFYDDAIMELDSFTDFQGGYGPVSPDPPTVISSLPGFGTTYFGFPAPGVADFVNGALQLLDPDTTALILDTAVWTKIFQICFTIDSIPVDSNFCPSIVWDLELDPADGGFLASDDGVVITVVDPTGMMMSIPSFENVVQFNWAYTGDGSSPPFGAPAETDCISAECPGSLSVTKTDSLDLGFDGLLNPGDLINYIITIVNDGPDSIFGITVMDTGVVGLMCIPSTPFTLGPGDTVTCTAFHVITQADIDSGFYVNVAIASGLEPDGDPVSDASDDPDDPTDTDPNGDGNPDDPTVTPLIVPPVPVITVRFSNPQYDCLNEEYCVDIEYQSDTDSLELFGMNVRFFYDDAILELIDFRDYQGGYGPVSPDPPTVSMSAPGVGYSLFGFGSPGVGVADFVNGAIQLTDDTQTPIYLSTTGWTKIFQICFNVDDPGLDLDTFCPPLVWDLEQNPANGGFLIGDDGVVITIVDPDSVLMSIPVDENVVQFNWQYIGPGTPPFGEPIELECISINCFPMITCAADVTISCDSIADPSVTGFATATDNCDGDPVITFSDVTVEGGVCPVFATITRTWIATNACDLSDTCIQLIALIDTTGPVILCPADVTIECTDSTDPSNTGEAVANDACDTAFITYIDIIVDGLCPQEYTIDRVWISTDSCGNFSICRQEIEVDDSTPPVITCPDDLTLECNDPVPTDTATATDNCSAIITYGFADIMCDNPIMGFTDIYDFSNWSILTPEGGSVTPVGNMEVILVSPDTTVPCPLGASVLFQIIIPSTGQLVFDWDYTSNDLDGPLFDPFGYNLNGTFFQLTNDLGPIMQSGTTTLAVTAGDTFAFEQNSIDCIFGDGATTVVEFFACTEDTAEVCTQLVIRTHTATDECGNTSACVQTLFIEDTTPPVITCPADTIIECDASTLPDSTGFPIVTDNCDTTLLIVFADSIIPGTCPQESTINRTWTATDACGNSSTCLQIIVVEDSTPPVLTCPVDLTIECTANTSPDSTGFATAIDNCDTLPEITFSDSITLGACPQEMTITRTWIAMDTCGNSDSCIQIIQIIDTLPPVITCPADTIIDCTSSTSPDSLGIATAIDNCDTLPAISFSDVSVAGSCPQEYTITRTWVATDTCGNSSNCVQIISIIDTLPPVITCPADTIIECTASTSPDSLGIATAIDNCDTLPAITFSDSIAIGTCPQEITITRTWVATDTCGNSSSCIQIISVIDTVPPIIACPVDITIECTDSTSPDVTGLASATDNCDTLPEITFSDVSVEGSCPQEMTITRTWVATDSCGNASSCIQIIQIIDTLPPVITCPADTIIECTASTSPDSTGFATAIDNCDTLPAITFSDVSVEGSCPQEYTITRTWVATDTCGNSSSCIQIISIIDTLAPVITCPADTIIECTASTSPDSLGIATAIDNCDTLPAITFSDVSVEGSCPQEYTITRTWIATDTCGNSSSCVQIISIIDTLAPVITCPADTIIECTASTSPDSLGIATAIDNCDTLPAITFSDVSVEGSCPQEYTITRTWVATDTCGNSSSCVQVISIIDTVPPVITCPADTIIECTASTSPDSLGFATATDNCDTLPSITFSDVSVAGSCPQEYTITRTWVATDSCGNASSCIQIIQIIDTLAPVITCPADTIIECTASTSPDSTGFATAIDNCDTLPEITFSDVSVAGSCPQEYTITRTWVATDTCGNSSSCVQIISIIDTLPPVITCPADTIIDCTASTSPDSTGIATAIDNCDTLPEITFSDVSVEGSCPQEYTITRTWVATDTCGNSSSCVQIISIIDTLAPVITCPADTIIECTASTSPDSLGIATAIDNCDTLPAITFSDVSVAGSCPQEYTITRTWVATDTCGNSSSCVQIISIIDTVPPVITCPADTIIECTASTSPDSLGFATATDNCDTLPLITFSDVSVAGSCPQEYTITRTWVATDTCGNSSSCSQIISIIDTLPPVLTCPADTIIECTASTSPDSLGIATATDNCDTLPAITFSDVSVAGSCPQEYTITRTWVASDTCGNSSSCVQIISIIDTVPPVITCPADTIIECTASTSPDSLGIATATDNCDTIPTITFSDITAAGTCPQEYTINRTWTAQDACGNSSTCQQVITIDDSTPPVLTCPIDVTIDCNESTDPLNTGLASATDNCDPAPIVDYADVTIDDTCPDILQRTWTATDACGNSSTCVQIITVDDTTPPVIICPADTLVVCASDIPDVLTGGVTTSDNCGFVTVTHGGDFTTDSVCLNQFTVSRVYVATDECGNSATCAQSIVVFDDVPPAITCPANLTVECTASTAPAATGSATATDNCEGTPTITFSDITVAGTCAQERTINRTWLATDVCGNSSTCLQTIFVDDTQPPTLTCPPNVTVSCASMTPPVNTGSVTTSDNCGGVVTVTHVGDVITNMTCANRFTLTRTYRATDACGNSATCNQVITVFDSTPPSITCPANITIDFGDDESPQNTGSPTGSDNCGGTPTFAFTSVTIPGMCPESYTIQRTWTATDACGNTATCLQIISVVGNCLLDLTLTKVYIDLGPVEGGDDVNFIITVTNEGQVSVGSIIITDYIPIGFSLNDPDWTPGTSGSTGQSASIELSIANGGLDPTGLGPGESVSVNITLQADLDIQPGLYANTAEISFVFDLNGNDVSANDIDSDADEDDTNDPAGEDDIDIAFICVLPVPVVTGDAFVCPDELTVYSVENYNPDFTYVWTLSGGGVITQDNGSDIEVQWQTDPGGPFTITLTIIIAPGCQATSFFSVFIQGVETVTCNDLIQISLGPDCEAVVTSGMILEGETEGNNNYFVVITDQFGNVIPNATFTGEHIGQCFMVSVQNICNDQSCWGTICVEDKIPPSITCTDAIVPCGTPLEPVFSPPITGSVSQSVVSGLSIGPNAGTITSQPIDLVAPTNALVTDINVTVDLDHTWSGDLLVELISPAGTSIVLANAVCGSADNWENVTFDDQASTPVAVACNVTPPPALLQGFVIPEEALSTFNNEFVDGTWTLQITDLADADGGTLNLVTLDVAYVESLPYAPVAIDSCGEVTLTYTETETGDQCDTITITRVWTATDESGNTATCVQIISVIPLDLDDVEFPENFIGECGDNTSPDFTGWPTLNGQQITDENALCNIFLGYWDKELAECGGGRKIVRTWTILDWCAVEFIEGVQVIKLTDNEPPILTCPDDFEVGTDFWYCYANVSVPKPIAVDACSDIASYSLTSTGGVIVAFGDNYVINELQIGTYTLTWTVTDECGNSSTCSFEVTVEDNVVPVANCDHHTIVSLTNDGPYGVTLVPASVFDDGSYDNCGPVTFRARRMDSCIDFDWTTEGACIDDVPGGIPPVNSRDRGTVHRPCVPFACCDVGVGPIMVELEVTDAAGNVNYCMVEAEVQDKISPFVECPPDIIVSCDFWFHVEEGTFSDSEGNNDGSIDEDPLSAIFGNMYDAFRYDESIRENIIINDPGNTDVFQPHNWGLDGWADDNCEVNLEVRVRLIDDCTGGALPGNAPQNAIKLIERRFNALDGNGISPGTCTQRIWVVDFNPFYISDQTCNNSDPQDGVIWPCDVVLTTCPDSLNNTGEPILFDDACSLIGVAYEDTRFEFVDGACFKILRKWSVIDWCQYNPQTGEGIWRYTQVIKVHDGEGPIFVDCPGGPVTLCVADTGVTLPDNNQAFLGEDNPLSSSCSAHLNLTRTVNETCSDVVLFDVKIYPFNGTDYWQVKQNGTATVDDQNNAVLSFNTRESLIPFVRTDGIPYNSPWCGEYHRILWSAQDGCGNWSTCEYLFRLEDCKQPSPVCINGLSTVVMPIGGQVTIWAKDFNASSFDDCTPAAELLYSFSGDVYEPSFTYTCENVPAFGVELTEEIWVADGGVDHNCNGFIEWSERNKDYCTTTIVITDNNDVCGGSGSILAGDIATDQPQSVEKVNVYLTSPGHFFPTFVTSTNGKYNFHNLAGGLDYTITPERKDNPKNGVSTLDLVRIQKHLLGKEIFTSPYQYIAADANNNHQVSAIDLVEIRKLILGIYNEFPANDSWRFVEKGFAVNPAHPWPFREKIEIAALSLDSVMHNDFVAVKVGDVNHTAKANLTQIQPRDGRRIMKILASVSGEAEAGKLVEMKLTFPEKIHGFQWTMETKGVEFAGIQSEIIHIDQQHIGLLEDGIVTMSWNEDVTAGEQTDEAITLVIRWKVTESIDVNDIVRLTSLVTEAEAYAPDEEILDVKLVYDEDEDALDFALYQNKPNPWNSQTTIGFDLPEDGGAVLTIFDVAGKEVYKVQGNYKAGYNFITVLAKDLPDTGVMYYRLDSGEYSASKKMVRIH